MTYAKQHTGHFMDIALQNEVELLRRIVCEVPDGADEEMIKNLFIKDMRQQAPAMLDRCDEVEMSKQRKIEAMTEGCEGLLTLRHRNLEALV